MSNAPARRDNAAPATLDAAPAYAGFGAADTAVVAAAETARAMVQARFMIAMHRLRDWETVRLRVLEAAKRPAFAEAAVYDRPVGGDNNAIGLSIRAAEELHRDMGNVDVSKMKVAETPGAQVWRVWALDLETNASHSVDVEVPKTVERKRLRKGQQELGRRKNSYGDTVYIIEASDNDLRTKVAAELSKAKRECVLALVPADVKEELLAACLATRRKKIAEDPKAAVRSVLEGFYKLGVKPDEVRQYCGKPIEQLRPEEIDHLRSLWSSIRDNETDWPTALAHRLEDRADKQGGGALDKAAEELEKAAAAEDKPKPEPAAPPPEAPADGSPLAAKYEEPKPPAKAPAKPATDRNGPRLRAEEHAAALGVSEVQFEELAREILGDRCHAPKWTQKESNHVKALLTERAGGAK